MGQPLGNGGFILDKPPEINAFRLLALKGRLKLEVNTGLKFSSRGPATGNMVRKEIGSTTRSKAKLLAEFETYLRQLGVLNDGKE